MSLKQSSPDSTRQHSLDIEGRSPCWHRGRELPCLRVVAQSEVFIFPYQQLHCARYTKQSECETLSVSFSTHEVIISGQPLDELVLALQELSVDWIKAMSVRYRAAPGNEGAWITRIEVKPVDQ